MAAHIFLGDFAQKGSSWERCVSIKLKLTFLHRKDSKKICKKKTFKLSENLVQGFSLAKIINFWKSSMPNFFKIWVFYADNGKSYVH